MGDKSPKAVQKQNSQKQTKITNEGERRQAEAARQAASKQAAGKRK
jgi:hypothetical protein